MPRATSTTKTPAGEFKKTGTLPPPESLTPAMCQYVEQKEKVGDAVLLYSLVCGPLWEKLREEAK